MCSIRPAACCLAVLLAVVVGGCDTVGSDVITLSKEVDFRFEFSTGGTEGGEPLQVDAVGTVDFADVLSAEGFSKDEVIAVNVQDVSVRRVTPAGTNLDVFDRLTFTLSASGLNVPPIAETEDVPSAREADLLVLAPGITEVVTQPRFRGRLLVVPAATHDEQYVLSATMAVVVQAEGV